MKAEYDVIVVGAGPAGSITARTAAEGGLDVLLIEKRQDSRKNYYSSRANLDEIMRMMLKTIHDDYVLVVLNQLEWTKVGAGGSRDPQVSEHVEFIENYETKLKGLESYLTRLLDVPLEERK